MQRILPSSIVVSILSGGIFVAAFFVVPQFIRFFGEHKAALPECSEWVLSLPCIGWLVLAVLVGVCGIAKDLYIREIKVAVIVNVVMVIAMLAVAGLIAYALYLPFITIVPKLG